MSTRLMLRLVGFTTETHAVPFGTLRIGTDVDPEVDSKIWRPARHIALLTA